MLKRLVFLCLLLPSFLIANPTAVEFYPGSLAVAKEKAAQEGKLYFVDFVASWCMPCRWMDETTFSDPRIGDYMNKNYVPVKVDIDDFDGYAYKQQYNIRVLPSLLIFNSSGQLVARIEESLPPSKLMEVLKTHNTSENRKIRAAVPPVISKPAPVKQAPVAKPPLIVKPPNRPDSYQSDLAPARPAPVTSSPAPRPAKPQNKVDGLYRFSIQEKASEGFSVQIGVYGEYANLMRETAKIEQKVDQPVLVHIAQLNGKTVYKILVGEFSNRNEADSLRKQLEENGTPGIIKDLSTL